MGAHAVTTPAAAGGRSQGGPARPLRVALVLPSLMVGGAEQHAVKLCRALDRQGVELCILLLRRDLTLELGGLVPSGVPVVIAPRARRDPRLVTWLAGEFRTRHIDVAQSFLWYADAIAATAALLVPGVRLICSERGDRSTGYHTPARRAYDRAVTFRRATAVVANSQFGAALLRRLGAPPGRVRVIPNGVDTDAVDATVPLRVRERLGWPPEAYLVVSVARLVEGKGLETLITAISRTKRPDIRAVLVGAGPLRPTLEALAAQLGVAGRVAFVGQQMPALPWLLGCDSAVQLSVGSEHCSNSLLEAMGCGKPVVASAVAGNAELVVDGETGLLVPPNDADAVAEALVRLASDATGAERLGAAGRARVTDRYSMDSTARRFTRVWAQAAGRA